MATNFTWESATTFAGDASPVDLVLAFDGLAVLGPNDLATVAQATEEVEDTWAVLIEDTVPAADEHTTGITAETTDRAQADEEALTTRTTNLLVEDTADGMETYELGGAALEDNVAAAVDEAESGVTLSVTDESTVATDEREGMSAAEMVEVVANATDEALPDFSEIVEDDADATEEMQIGVVLSLSDESTVATDEHETNGAADEDLVVTDLATAADESFIQITATNTVTDDAVATDEAFYKKPGAIAWVMNTETTAASWYSNFQFVDLVQASDTVYAVGPEGLHVLGGNTDNNEAIDAHVQYGFTDFGSAYLKRVESLRFGYVSDGLLSMDVETYGQGNPIYTYKMEKRVAEQPRNNRIIPGKGLRSRYWRLTIRNIDGAGFSVDDSSADLAVTTRRL